MINIQIVFWVYREWQCDRNANLCLHNQLTFVLREAASSFGKSSLLGHDKYAIWLLSVACQNSVTEVGAAGMHL